MAEVGAERGFGVVNNTGLCDVVTLPNAETGFGTPTQAG